MSFSADFLTSASNSLGVFVGVRLNIRTWAPKLSFAFGSPLANVIPEPEDWFSCQPSELGAVILMYPPSNFWPALTGTDLCGCAVLAQPCIPRISTLVVKSSFRFKVDVLMVDAQRLT